MKSVWNVLVIWLAAGAVVLAAMKPVEDAEAVAEAFPGPLKVERKWKVVSSNQLDLIEKETGLRPDSELFDYYEAYDEDEVSGRAVITSEKGKHGAIRIMVVLEPDHRIRLVRVLSHKEKRGKAVAEKKFLSQFTDKRRDDRIRLNDDIQGITGATISSRAVTAGVRRTLSKTRIILDPESLKEDD